MRRHHGGVGARQREASARRDLTGRARRANVGVAGNVRELASAIEHAVIFCTSSQIAACDLPERMRQAASEDSDVAAELTRSTATASSAGRAERVGPGWLPPSSTLHTLDEVNVFYVRHVLALAQGNKRRAAALLGVSRRTLYRYLQHMEDGPGVGDP